MRPIFTKAAMAALILSSSMGMALAAHGSVGVGNFGGVEANDGGRQPADGLPAAAMANPSYGAPRYVATAPMAPMHVRREFRPRLDAIVGQLDRINHRIRVDSRDGRLTRHEQVMMRQQERSIRHSAMQTAAAHRGRLPQGAFVRYEREIHNLGHRLNRMSSNA